MLGGSEIPTRSEDPQLFFQDPTGCFTPSTSRTSTFLFRTPERVVLSVPAVAGS